jgi:TetR/AcrR family acrAB operon transcriptional repressor
MHPDQVITIRSTHFSGASWRAPCKTTGGRAIGWQHGAGIIHPQETLAMVRRSKADALATRDNILDCAECLFVRQGVSRTTLQHIAAEAGVTRGAIYWHFQDKAAVFNAMLQRVKMPLESALQVLGMPDRKEPLNDLETYVKLVFELTESDPKACRVFEIATLKIEYVNDMSAVRERRAEMVTHWTASAESMIGMAIRSGQVRQDVQPREAALGLWALIDGLLRAWMIDPASFRLAGMGGGIVGMYLDALRLRAK